MNMDFPLLMNCGFWCKQRFSYWSNIFLSTRWCATERRMLMFLRTGGLHFSLTATAMVAAVVATILLKPNEVNGAAPAATPLQETNERQRMVESIAALVRQARDQGNTEKAAALFAQGN